MSMHQARRASAIGTAKSTEQAVATAYNDAGDDYIAYADGNPERLFDFAGHYAYGDRCIWEVLEAKLVALRASGARSVRILDLGCGPGTWLRRVVTRAHKLGFAEIAARGFDIAGRQIRRACELSVDLFGLPGVGLRFEIGDMLEPLHETDASVDLCLCLCGVLNHLAAAALPALFSDVARVTNGHFVTTARTVGSTPSVYVDSIEQARRFLQDNRINRLDIELQNGRHLSLPSHLFSAGELRSLIAPYFGIEDLCGLDLFHGRFAADPRWNPDCSSNMQFEGELDRLERSFCRELEFIDHATHLLLVGKPLQTGSMSVAGPISSDLQSC